MTALIVIGSNAGNREENISRALSMLESCGLIINSSSVYETPDCLGVGRKYLNMVLELDTDVTEEMLNRKIKDFERECGRDASARQRGEVCIDIDIVKWGEEVRRPADYRSYYFRKGLQEVKNC